MTAAAIPGKASTDGRLPAVLLSLVLFAAFIGFSPVFTGGPDRSVFAEEDGNVFRQAIFSLLFVMIAGTAAYRRGLRDLLNVPLPLVVLLGWCWLSITWAIEPGISFRRVLFTTLIALSVVYSVNQLKPRVVMQIVAFWFGMTLILDWAAVLLSAKAIHQPNEIDADPALVGNWRGLHPHKNEAGPFCAIVALLFLDMIARKRSYITAPILTGLALVFLFMTASKASIGLVFLAAGVGVLFVLSHDNPELRKVLLIVSACLLFGLVLAVDSNWLAVIAWFEDPSSLTGRVQIWPVLLDYASDHPLFGSGYGSFWGIGSSSPIFERTSTWVTILRQAHNGYIDLLIQTGWIGLLLAVAVLVVYPAYILFTQKVLAPPSRWLIGAVLSFCWMHDTLETSLFDRAHPVWVIALIFYSLLLRQAQAARSVVAGPGGEAVAQVGDADADDEG